MGTDWLPLQSFSPEGRLIVLENQRVWEAPIAKFGILCRVARPLRATVRVLPQEQGVLFRGRLSGAVFLPCVLCAEDSLVLLDERFDCFEPLPADPQSRRGRTRCLEEADEAVIRLSPHGGYEVNPAALAWEEFSLALPPHPLCREDCKGLCPVCGANRNRETCVCARGDGATFAPLLRLTAAKKI
ncbi:MAG: DUF177 domain-containing protein [Desulfovibrio sp.]|nr:DUF177 domain-containing protein [Desulfovibrio sp.]